MTAFLGYFGSILYSGDMRWYPELADHPALKGLIENHDLHTLYLGFRIQICDGSIIDSIR